MRDLIFISLENWDDIWRRNQHLCAQLFARFPGMRILFVERPRDVSHAVRTVDFSPLYGPAFRSLEQFPGLTLFRPTKLFPNSLGICRRWNSLHLLTQVRAAARTARLSSPLLWINDHFAESLTGALGESGVVYDITDDWALMPSIPKAQRIKIRQADAALCAKADLVVVCSKGLEHSRGAISRNLVCIPNGVEIERYLQTDSDTTFRALESHEKTSPAGPVFGYVGTLHADRLDLDLLAALAAAFPSGRIILCGPNLLGSRDQVRLQTLGNLELRPPVHYSRVPEVLAGFDVTILPHRCTPFTESLNPIKLWEYLASGKPIAATPVAGFRDYPDLCHLGLGGDGFVRACKDALAELPHLSIQRIGEAVKHSWSGCLEALLNEFEKLGWMERSKHQVANVRGFPRMWSPLHPSSNEHTGIRKRGSFPCKVDDKLGEVAPAEFRV